MKIASLAFSLVLIACSAANTEDNNATVDVDNLSIDRYHRFHHHDKGACVFGMGSACSLMTKEDCFSTYPNFSSWSFGKCDLTCTLGGCNLNGMITWHYSFPGGYGNPNGEDCSGFSQIWADDCAAFGGSPIGQGE